MGQQNSTAGASSDIENGDKKKKDLKLRPLKDHSKDEPDEDLSSELRKAAADRNVKEVDRLLSTNADPKRCDLSGRNALHHACRHELGEEGTDIEKLLSLLLEKGCAEVINATDRKGNTALWYAIKHRNSRAAIVLIENRADFKSRRKEDKESTEGNTLFHEACLAGLLDVVEKMIFYTNRDNPVKWKGHKDATPLHAACKNSHLAIVKKLINGGAKITAKDKTGKTPLHAAASGVKVDGTIETVDYLLKNGAMGILNKSSKSSEEEEAKTPLSTACFYGHHKTVEFLLEKGAVVDANCMKFAVEKDFSYTARVLVQSSQWRKCLRQILPNGDPIMNEIIRRMPEVALDVLDKCTVQRQQTRDEKGCFAFNFEFLECFKEKGSSFEDEVQGAASEYVDDAEGLAKHHAKKDIAKKEKEFEDVIKQRKQSFGPRWGLKTFKKSQHPLTVIAKSEDCRLLTHPVVRALLHYKWMPYGFGYYLTNILVFLVFLIFATSFSLSLDSPFSQDCPIQGNGTCDVPASKRRSILALSVITILLAVIRLIMRLGREIFLMSKLRKKYFSNIYVLFDWTDIPSYVFIIVFATSPYHSCPCPEVWQWQIGIIGLFLAWLTLLKFANKFPVISKYILMFWRIVETFGKVALSIGIPLVLAFAWPFYMALYDPEVSRSPFQNAGISIAKVLSMTTGSSNYDNIFRLDSTGDSDTKDELPFLPVTYILWIIFVILMPLLLNYLLVGLAIGDIKSVEEHAELRKLALKVQLVLEFEELLPSLFRSKLRPGHRVVYPWKPKKLKWLKHEHESPEALEQVFERAQHQAWKYNPGKQAKAEHHHHNTEHPVKHATARKYNFGGEQYHHSADLEERLQRVEDLLERVAEKMNVPLPP